MMLRHQTYRLDGIYCSNCGISIELAIKALKGVQEVDVDTKRHSVRVVYDLTQVDSSQIEEMLDAAGYPVASSWWNRLKLGWIHYTERNMAENLRAAPPDCCSNPKKLYRK